MAGELNNYLPLNVHAITEKFSEEDAKYDTADWDRKQKQRAAAKQCRIKKRMEMQAMEEYHQELETEKTKLWSEVRRLERLESQLRTAAHHVRICSSCHPLPAFPASSLAVPQSQFISRLLPASGVRWGSHRVNVPLLPALQQPFSAFGESFNES